MLNVALGQLLALRLKQNRARSTSNRRVQMGNLTTKTIERAMHQLRLKGFTVAPTVMNFFDRRGRTAGTLKPERLKASVRDKVLANSKTQGCWFAFAMSIMDGYHSVLLLVDRTAADGRIYWLDQFSTGVKDDVTESLDQRLTDVTQRWWQHVMDTKRKGYNTTIRLWPLMKPRKSELFVQQSDEEDEEGQIDLEKYIELNDLQISSHSLFQVEEERREPKKEIIYINPEYKPVNFWLYPHPRVRRTNHRLTVFDFKTAEKKVWENWNGDLPPKSSPDSITMIRSVLDLYEHIKKIGDRAPATLIGIHFFTHGVSGGPIIFNTFDTRRDPLQRDPDDKDPRIKDFSLPDVVGGREGGRFKNAFSSGALVKLWGCNYIQNHRDQIKRYMQSRSDVEKRSIKRQIQDYIRDHTYQFALSKAIGIPVYAAPLGWGTNPYLPFGYHGSEANRPARKYPRTWPPVRGVMWWRVSQYFRPDRGDQF